MKIMIADDHALYRDGLRLNLSNMLPKAQILDASSFTQALELLKLNNDTDLILADLDMPEANWENGIKAIKEYLPDVRIGVISASEDSHNIKKALSLGVCCYLPKNIDTKVLNSALGLVLNGATYFPPTLLKQAADKAKADFIAVMDDDLNTADALSKIFELVSAINTTGDKQNKETLEYAAKIFDELCGVMGLLYNRKTDEIPQKVKDLVEERTQVRKEKNWARADEIRDELAQLGYVVKDTPQGPQILAK